MIAGILIPVFLAACSSGGGGGGGGGGGTGTGTLNILLTDASTCGYDHIYITVDYLEISTNGTTWSSIPVEPGITQPLDLLGITNGNTLNLATVTLATGAYQQIRMVLKANGNTAPWANSIVLTGTTAEIPLTTPSAQQSGTKILGPITVQDSVTTDLILDFNACKSIVAAGKSGKYLLNPVLTATAAAVSGTISGFALAGSKVIAYAEDMNTTFLSETSIPGTSGASQFNLGPLLSTSAPGSYPIDVVIVPPASAGQGNIIVQGVPVTAGASTWISPSDGSAYFNNATVTASNMMTVSGAVSIGTPQGNSSPGAANIVVSQTVSSLPRIYEITRTVSDPVSGAYSLLLASSGPWLGTYSTTLPIALTRDVNSLDVGRYTIVASDTLTASAPQAIDVSSAPLTGLNFYLSQ